MTQVWTIVIFSFWGTILAHCDFSNAKTLRTSHGKVNYTEADKACKSNDHRSQLAKVQTIEDLQLAKNMSNTTNGIRYWTGLNIWNGTWKWSDGKMTGEQLVKIVKNYNDTKALSKEPKMFCCVVTHDALLECTNCSEKHAFLCEDFQENIFPQVDSNSSCIPASPQLNASARNASCIFYEYKGEFCKDTITSLYVYGNQSTLDFGEFETESFEAYFKWFGISKQCQPIIKDLYCRYHFPPCDETLGEPKDRRICRSSCVYLMYDVCKQEADILRKAVETSPDVETEMINCSYYITANGGDAPECYQWPDIPGDEINSTDCYYGVGVGYHGNVNVTRSGRTCQSWKSQCPHRHWRIPKDVADSQNDSNMCRNPDRSAPDGPWCYTTDPKVRWEYCNVSRCPPREKPPPPRDFAVKNVQATYLILAWKEPENASIHQIQSYKIERKASGSENFTVAKIVPHPGSRMIMEDLEPSTEYTIRLSSSNMYRKSSDGIFLTQRTLPNRFIMNLMLIIVLPLGIAFIFIVTVCVKFGSIGNSRPNKVYDEAVEISIRRNWVEVRRSDVTLQDKLGEGAFGEVFKGVVRLKGKSRACAIKKLKENTSEKEREDLLNELQILVTVGEHPNIISLIGACTKSGSIWVIVSLAPNGCLLNELKKNRENPYYNDMRETVGFTRVDKVKIARDVACGMSYLASKKCVHRDLAARNVLLGDRNVAMVSDFGLSRDVYESGEYESLSRGMLPVRWMALESLDFFTFNTKTDVWSFGVLLWEIESEGIMPYCDLGGAMEIIDYLQSGQILAKPDGCPNEFYDMMKSCWDLDPIKRPSFTDLLALLEKELTGKKDDLLKDKNLPLN
ncbi:tyrosine-protein kinase receptor Tie-2-like [Stylophora pistillata]|uniref:tyrosine-protein kinase receptor Tie-2-like n=1 Tax=Stylophora pistillata TaxID=50429 RepID=UPI000C04DC8B|nr:tyrosine-protein kinase receptor Tie-2-like [Stylophora pistillata]XP_022787752.1 tyrosine-protein kinase receptor Tie-2-like [Stylophora pistillata]XP_022787753.1 tyrosine-protein kinase receptor Tie-2-like [Stylophora pistillata]